MALKTPFGEVVNKRMYVCMYVCTNARVYIWRKSNLSYFKLQLFTASCFFSQVYPTPTVRLQLATVTQDPIYFFVAPDKLKPSKIY